MAKSERVTVTLPARLVRTIDSFSKNWNRFIAEAVEREAERRLTEQLEVSLRNPHPEQQELEGQGLGEWAQGFPPEEESLVDWKSGTPVRWVEGEGWVEDPP